VLLCLPTAFVEARATSLDVLSVATAAGCVVASLGPLSAFLPTKADAELRSMQRLVSVEQEGERVPSVLELYRRGLAHAAEPIAMWGF
jgi:hypothetical protein